MKTIIYLLFSIFLLIACGQKPTNNNDTNNQMTGTSEAIVEQIATANNELTREVAKEIIVKHYQYPIPLTEKFIYGGEINFNIGRAETGHFPIEEIGRAHV